MNKIILIGLTVVCLVGFGIRVEAEEKPEEEAQDEKAPAVLERPIYVPVKPAFVVNYGGPGKLKYLKLEISLRVKDTSASNATRHHMPLIRDYLVKVFSRQMDEDIDTQQGKEQLRVSALEGVQNLLMEEDGEQGVTNLLFNSFVMQR
ncbi:hypothetical protein AB835_05285 [Candidatus Endobugula sertula]|uniref:Flagellar protein FliL n=1 Tax=Candidatus Endobugula sertula TaxID=62101 RepID=A0A1D2QRI1_9GAMM|nr:hypothetical protein AB835_05285 [Candidatus Endobugula sertula]